MPKVSEITDQNYVDLAVMIGANIRSLPPESVARYLSTEHRGEIPEALQRGFSLTGEQERQKSVNAIQPLIKYPTPPDLTKTGPTFGDRLKAREELHKF